MYNSSMRNVHRLLPNAAHPTRLTKVTLYFPAKRASPLFSPKWQVKKKLFWFCHRFGAWTVNVCKEPRSTVAGGASGTRQTYTYETLVQYADSPLSKLPPAGLAAFPPELARKVTLAAPRRAPPPRRPAASAHAPAPAPAHLAHSQRVVTPFRAWTPLHHPNYLAALLCRNFYWPPAGPVRSGEAAARGTLPRSVPTFPFPARRRGGRSRRRRRRLELPLDPPSLSSPFPPAIGGCAGRYLSRRNDGLWFEIGFVRPAAPSD